MPSATVMRIPRRSLPRSNGSRPGCARARRSRLPRMSAAGSPRWPMRSRAHARSSRQSGSAATAMGRWWRARKSSPRSSRPPSAPRPISWLRPSGSRKLLGRRASAASTARSATHSTQIYTACSFQDLTGQRTDKVIEALRFVEDRIATMIDIWGKGPGTQTPEAPSVHARPPVGFPESLLDQSDVDGMLPAMPVEHPPATSLHADAQGPQSELPQAEPAAEHAGPQAEAVGLLDRILDVVRRSMAEPEEAAPAAAPPPGKARGRLMDFVSPLLPI